MDQFEALDCALCSHYLELDALANARIWGELPVELRVSLASALITGEPLGTVRRLVWQVRVQLLGEPDSSRTRGQEKVLLKLGLLYLRHRDGRLDARELLAKAFHVADSYVCEVDPRPFLLLRLELESGGQVEDRIALLFAPYTMPAEQSVQQWGLRPVAVNGESIET